MRAEATIVDAKLLHALELGDTLRPEDLDELAAIGDHDPHRAIVDCLEASTVAFTALYGGEVGAMFGCGPVKSALSAPEGLGFVWFLTGQTFVQHPRAFMRPARAVMALLLEQYPVLVNYIDARYAAAVRWAKWLGFSVGEPVPYGPNGMLFHPARLEARTWVA